MEILVVSLLILFGLLFCIVEILILPGVSVGGIISAICNGWAIYMAFDKLGPTEGVVVVAIILTLTIVAILFSLRAKTWRRLSLNNKLESTTSSLPQERVSVGDRGVSLSRLAPMGKVEISDETFEAKSKSAYIDAKTEIEVVAFENFNVVVQEVNKEL